MFYSNQHSLDTIIQNLSANTREFDEMRQSLLLRSVLGLMLLGVLAGSSLWCVAHPGASRAAEDKTPDRDAVQRAHDTVKLLDDVHKGYVVNITATYVKAKERTPAAHVAKKVFDHVEKNGGPKVRLIDATGAPIHKANVAKSDFEKRAIEKLNKGESYYSEVGRERDRPVLRAATRVPVVMKACINCHPGFKEGDLLGALIYEVPIK
jgi:hypothetical protein